MCSLYFGEDFSPVNGQLFLLERVKRWGGWGHPMMYGIQTAW
jgi:hypothetical protein